MLLLTMEEKRCGFAVSVIFCLLAKSFLPNRVHRNPDEKAKPALLKSTISSAFGKK